MLLLLPRELQQGIYKWVAALEDTIFVLPSSTPISLSQTPCNNSGNVLVITAHNALEYACKKTRREYRAALEEHVFDGHAARLSTAVEDFNFQPFLKEFLNFYDDDTVQLHKGCEITIHVFVTENFIDDRDRVHAFPFCFGREVGPSVQGLTDYMEWLLGQRFADRGIVAKYRIHNKTIPPAQCEHLAGFLLRTAHFDDCGDTFRAVRDGDTCWPKWSVIPQAT